MLGLQNEREWKAFCDTVLQNPALATDPRFDANAKRNAHREALKALILDNPEDPRNRRVSILLFNDPTLYNNLNATTENAASLLEDLKEHPKRYVHFSLFGKKDK